MNIHLLVNGKRIEFESCDKAFRHVHATLHNRWVTKVLLFEENFCSTVASVLSGRTNKKPSLQENHK